MKRYTKFLSVLLCLVVLISVVTMAATAQEAGNAGARANDIKQGVVYKPVSPSRLTLFLAVTVISPAIMSRPLPMAVTDTA